MEKTIFGVKSDRTVVWFCFVEEVDEQSIVLVFAVKPEIGVDFILSIDSEIVTLQF